MTEHWPLLDLRVRSGVTAKTLASVKRPDARSLCDRTLAGCARLVLMYADVRRTEETLNDRTLGEFGRENSCLEPYWKQPDAGVLCPVTF